MISRPRRTVSRRLFLLFSSVALVVLLAWVFGILAPTRPNPTPFVATDLTEDVGELPEGLFDYPVLDISDGVLTSMAALPGGDLILGLRDGRLFRFDPRSEERPRRAFYELQTIQTVEGGIIGLAVSPDFRTDAHLYVNYTELADDGTEHLTICRLTVDPRDPGRALPGSYEVVHRIEDELPSEIHYGGGMAFGADGHLYVGIGDDASAPNAQNPESLRGKLLRLLPDGGVPEDNPVWTAGSEPSAVYAMGLRNPFRLVVDPITHHIYVHDVGNTVWEEANLLEAGGSNYGWPIVEGPLEANPGIQPPENYVDPFFSYRHRGDGTSSAIVGGLVYRGDRLPEAYRNTYLVGDYDQISGSLLRLIVEREPQLRVVAAERFYETPGAIVDLVELDGAIYYSTIWADFSRPVPWTSEVRRIDVLKNPLPRITLPVSVISRVAPARIESEAQIAYPRPEELRLEWRLGDELVGTGARLSTTVEARGVYPLTLRAIEPFGAYAEDTIRVRVFGQDRFSLDVAVDDIEPGGSAESPSVRLHLIDPLAGTTASTLAGGELRPFASVDGETGRVRVPPTPVALLGDKLRVRLESPGLVPWERDVSLRGAGSELPSRLHLSARALQVRAATPGGEPLAGLQLQFSIESGPPLPQTDELLATDLSGRLYVPLTEAQAASNLLAAPSVENTSIYTDVRYRLVTPSQAEDWTLTFSPRDGARMCDPLEPSDSPATYEEVQSVFSEFCVGCHNNNQPAADLSLLEGFSISELHRRDSSQMPGRKLLDSASPRESYLLEKMDCLVPSHGYLMPPSSRGLLSEGDRQVVTNWVHQGMAMPTALDLQLSVVPDRGVSPLPVRLRAGAVGGTPPYEVRWELGDGETSDAWSVEHSYHVEANSRSFRGSVTVRDADGLEKSSPFEIRVAAPDGEAGSPPEAEVLVRNDRARSGQSLRLEVVPVSLPGGSLVHYEWDFGDDGTVERRSSDPEIVHRLTEVGDVPLRVRFVDSKNVSGESILVLEMEPASFE